MEVYGYVNGKPVYSRDEFVFTSRGFGAITDDAELMAFAEKMTGGWSDAGWRRKFTHFYLSDWCCREPHSSLTDAEFERLKVLQEKAKEEERRAEEERCWRLVGRHFYADNSVDEEYEDKDGNTKTVLIVYPHGDSC